MATISEQLTRHFRLIEAIGILLMSAAALLELYSVTSYERTRVALVDAQIRSYTEEKLQDTLLEIKLRLATLEDRGTKSQEEARGEAEAHYILLDSALELASNNLAGVARLNKIRNQARLGSLPVMQAVEQDLKALTEKYTELHEARNSAKTRREQFILSMEVRKLLEKTTPALVRAENKTLSELAWTRARHQRVYFMLFAIGSFALVIGKFGNWLKETPKQKSA